MQDGTTRFDEVLSRSDGSAIAEELAALRSPGRMDGAEATIVTQVRPVSPDETLPRARFTPLTDWIRPSY